MLNQGGLVAGWDHGLYTGCMTTSPHTLPKPCPRHFGVLRVRAVRDDLEYLEQCAWGLVRPEVVTENICQRCGAVI